MGDARTGVYRATTGAYGFVTPEDGGEDWFVPPRKNGGAWDGDTVQVESEADTDGERDTVRVIKVLRRAHTAVTGILRKHDHKCWLEPDERKLPSPMLVTGKLHNAHAGDRVAVAVRSYAAGLGQTPSGEVVQIFGPAGELAAIVAAILYNHHIQPAFPDAVMEEALSIPETLTEQDLAGRLDLRTETIVTIDGASSRDFDDAVSLTRDEAGNWRLGVHIADVSHYVRAKSALDREAWERGTSVYFADRVVPMLPIALSNGICSLNPQVDRLTISCLMTLDRTGTILDHSLAKSVICSTERMTYEDCNVLLAGGDSALEARYAHILPMLRDMDQLAAALKKRRRARGALMLESSEVAIACDEEGRPTGLSLRQPGRAESLIEECMLAANETVARHLHDAGQPCVYRIHEKPASDKLEALRAMLNPLGYTVGQGDGFALQAVLDAAQDKPEAPMVNTMLLRAMQKARYSAENQGHFGLAAPYYCHFTSPIRRYPDLMVHRVLSHLLAGGEDLKAARKLTGAVEYAAAQSSQREVEATAAEREIEACYAAQFMAGHIGERFSGVVSGVTRFGLFVLLANGAEGMLPAEALPPDDYQYDENAMALVGRQRSYRFGTPMEVIVAAADPAAGQIDFRLEGVAYRPEPAARRPEREGSGGAFRRSKAGRPAMHVPKSRGKRSKGRKRR